MKKKFVLIGVGGFIAPRHLKAIKDNNCELVASYDIVDSVGIIDSFFPKSLFFNNFSSFEKFITQTQNSRTKIDYLVVCSPNFLHHSHIKFALNNKMNVICEKPLVIDVRLLKGLFKLEKEMQRKIYCILQLRINETIFGLKQNLNKIDKFYDCELNYNTPRGNWYDYSWKGDKKKSGGILYNIGIHLFDILIWIFGKYTKFEIFTNGSRSSEGILYFKNAKIKWNLSINQKFNKEFKSERSLRIDSKIYELTGNFENSHSICYSEILNENKIFFAKSTIDSLNLISEMEKNG